VPLADGAAGAVPVALRRPLQRLGAWIGLAPDPEHGLVAGEAVPAALPAPIAAFSALTARLRDGCALDPGVVQLLDDAVAVWMRPGFETFISLPRLRFQPYPHQLRAAETVLRRMRGRALLADEVGLGKTIEAGLVLSELFLRRLARRCLVLVPPGLVEQWAGELDQKFALPVTLFGGPTWERMDRPWETESGIVLASLAAVRRGGHAEAAAAAEWDLVIVDEAHRLKNASTASSRLVKSLRSRFLLLLTATPVENRLSDLYQLVQLVRPGHLGTPAEFRRLHGGATGEVRAPDALRARMREIMVRHRRSEVEVMLPRRLAETVRIAPDPEEAALYAAVTAEVRRRAAAAGAQERLGLRTLQRLIGSSPRAAAPSLARAGLPELAAAAAAITDTRKARALVELLGRHARRGEKVAVFTAFRNTQAFLVERLSAEGIGTAVYHGGLDRHAKDAAIAAFRGPDPVLLTTEAAGEGRNLQFAHILVNFDLPWNPMQIEQRLGRVHRIGQTEDVLVTNLLGAGTLEEHIFGVLEAKIHLFELVVGELDMILGRVEDDFDFESFVFEAFTASSDDAEFARRLEEVGERLAQARATYVEGRARNDTLLPEAAGR
jgi:SNF2 family DNA or RNA helicase